MKTLRDYYEKYIAQQREIANDPFIIDPLGDSRTEEEKVAENTLYTGCSPTCIHPYCPLWDKEHSKRLFDL